MPALLPAIVAQADETFDDVCICYFHDVTSLV
jgi:hypothetical protein